MVLMLILRLIHGLLSLIAVFIAYKIAHKLAGRDPAIAVGLMMAALAWMPILSVHQLVEMSVITPLLASSWVLLRKEPYSWNIKTLILSGLWLGIATGLRYQVGVMGLGLVAAQFLIFRNDTRVAIRNSIVLGLSALAFFTLTQVPTDLYLWGESFAQLRAYIEYNLTSSGEYPQGGIFTYIAVLLLLTAPPISIIIVFGYLKSWRKHVLLVLPSLAFIVFHYLFPNKQERFILPALPYVIIVGTIFLMELKESHSFFTTARGRITLMSALIVTITINTALLVALTVSSKNTSQMKAMYSLHEKGDMESFLYVTADGQAFAPRFYSGSWADYAVANSSTDIYAQKQTHCENAGVGFPNYIILVGDSHLDELTQEFKEVYTSMNLEGEFSPGRLDRFINYLNPRNPIKRTVIYKIDPTLECSNFEIEQLDINEPPF
jgi:4-amino-4-deoxy-L-arabinose transferase-like glycosyltransferase